MSKATDNQTPELRTGYAVLITSVNPTVPTKGTNAGRQMYIINGEYWSRSEPQDSDTHVVLDDVDVKGKTYTNVVGFSKDSRMSIDKKIALLTAHDAGYSMAIASLLK